MLRINQTLVVLNLSENGMGDEDEEGQWTRAEEAMLAFGTSIEMLEPHFEEPKDESKEATVEMFCNAMTKQDSAVDLSAFKEAMLQACENPVPACLQALADGLKANTRVQQLHAKSNGLRAAGAMAFGEVLKTNKTLAVLDLSENEIGAWTQEACEETARLRRQGSPHP